MLTTTQKNELSRKVNSEYHKQSEYMHVGYKEWRNVVDETILDFIKNGSMKKSQKFEAKIFLITCYKVKRG